jgi:uncharacterized LabA/DUF88 family protein
MEKDQILAPRKQRVHVFIDFWNFQLTLKNIDEKFSADFRALGPVLVDAAMAIVDEGAQAEYAGMGVYMSTDEKSEAEAGLRRWATNTLDRFPGVNVTMIPRVKVKSGPKCPSCHNLVQKCPACGEDMRGTEEKGVDVRIATDMVMLAWVDSYDIAVLVSSDSDFVPVASFLQTKGKKIIHGQLPPRGALLSQKCWGSIDLIKLREKFRLGHPVKTKQLTLPKRG